MKRLAATICLTTAVLLGSVGVSESADYQKGFTAYKSGDYATALREWTPLAKQGNADAQFNLGLMYDEGQGVPEDNMKAVHWYRFAAWQGHASAQGNLGAMYALGAGVKKDFVRAHMWGSIAKSIGGKDRGKVRDYVEEIMTPAQIAEAQKLARECIRKEYLGC